MSAATRCVLFDLDGTLVDTAADLGRAANYVRKSLGLEALPLADYRPAASSGARGLLRIALGITPDHIDFPVRRESFLAHYRDNLSRHSRPFEGMDETLEELESRGLKWGVVTNKPKVYTDALLRALRLDRRAAVVVSADEAQKPKPAPDPLLLACFRARVTPEECVYVGDDKRDVDAGRAAGIRTIAVTWGYEGEHPIRSWGADALINKPEELLRLV